MAWQRPTLIELISRVKSGIITRLGGSTPALRRSVIDAIARTIGGAAHEQYGYLERRSRAIHPDTSEGEDLARHARFWLGDAHIPAAVATGQVVFTGTDGSVIAAGAEVQRADGALYSVDAEVTVAGGTATAEVTADAAGADGNADAGATLALVSPIEGVDAEATVDSDGIGGGADRETDDALLARILGRVQNPPHGGAGHDYVAWAREVAGVTRAWCLPLWLGAGTVGVTFVRDNDDDLIPSAGEVADVQDYIDSVRPVTADVTVFAPTPVKLDFTISLTPDTTAVRAAVQAELEDLLLREAEPEDGDGSGTILVSHIREAISLAAGETDHALNAPAADVTLAAGEMSVMGTITWS